MHQIILPKRMHHSPLLSMRAYVQYHAQHCNVVHSSLYYKHMLHNILLCINLCAQHTIVMHQIILPRRMHHSPLSCRRAYVHKNMLQTAMYCIYHSIAIICSPISFGALIFINSNQCSGGSSRAQHAN